jgi:hypothetical protein
MNCKTCGSDNLGHLPAEIAIHFPGSPRVSEPAVFVFTQLTVCWSCGNAEFTILKNQLIQLAKED